jgi:hypothetical protein
VASELFSANRATTTVSSGGTTAPSGGSSETWTVASSAMFGAAATGISQFHVADPAAPSEIIAVTNVSGTTWTVTRGAESTTPVTHAAGFTVYQVTTAGWLAAVSAGTTLPLTILGDTLYENATPALARLPGNTSATKNFLTQAGTGSVSAAPAWGTIAAGDLPAVAALLTGATFTGHLAPAVAALTFVASGTTLVNAALGNAFNLTLTASTTTLGNPSSPVDGQVIRFRITQGTGGSFTLAYGSAYDFGAAGVPTLSTAAGKVDILGFEYVASISGWCYLGSGLGF